MKCYKYGFVFRREIGNFVPGPGIAFLERSFFMFTRFLAFAGLSILLLACSSTLPKAELATHEDSSRNIPKIDRMIVGLKKSYISQCYSPILKKNPPENQCQTELFQMLERRYHMNYNQHQIDLASNELFFRDVDTRLRKMVRTDPEIRGAIRRGAFSSADEMLSYYRTKYSFDTQVHN